jgi:hypothetical protein
VLAALERLAAGTSERPVPLAQALADQLGDGVDEKVMRKRHAAARKRTR